MAENPEATAKTTILTAETVILTAVVGLVNEGRAFFHPPGPNYTPLILTREQYDKLDSPRTIEVAIRKAT